MELEVGDATLQWIPAEFFPEEPRHGMRASGRMAFLQAPASRFSLSICIARERACRFGPAPVGRCLVQSQVEATWLPRFAEGLAPA